MNHTIPTSSTYVFGLFLHCIILLSSTSLYAQACVYEFPIYPDREYKGMPISKFLNSDMGDVVDVQLLNDSDEVVLSFDQVAPDRATISFSYCDVLTSGYRILVSGQLEDCEIILSPQSSNNVIIENRDTAVYIIDELANNFTPEYINTQRPNICSPCHSEMGSLDMIHVEDSIVDENCNSEIVRTIYRKWQIQGMNQFIYDIIRIVALPDLGDQDFVVPDMPTIHSYLEEEKITLDQEYQDCQWQHFQDKPSIINCATQTKSIAFDAMVDKWQEPKFETYPYLLLPALNRTGNRNKAQKISCHLTADMNINYCSQVFAFTMDETVDNRSGETTMKYYLSQQKDGEIMTSVNREVRYQKIDNIAPGIHFEKEVFEFSAENTNQEYLDISAPTPVWIQDNCSGIESVHVSGGHDHYYMKYDKSRDYWYSQKKIRCPIGEKTKITYTVYDKSKNVKKHHVYVHPKRCSPKTTISWKKNISIHGEKDWISVSQLSRSSHSNWHKQKVYARRLDWEEFCIDLCPRDEVDLHNTYDINHIDPLTVLGDRKGDYHVEEHYHKQIHHMLYSRDKCEKKIGHAWLNAIREYWTENCLTHSQHGYSYGKIDEKDALGGGWCKEVPFSCEDACKEVMIEILYMDDYCHWHKDWITVNVKSAAITNRKIKELQKITISCEAYEDYYKEIIENAIAAGSSSNGITGEEAFAKLDEALGTYRPAYYTDHYGWATDKHGHKLDQHFTYYDKKCYKNYQLHKRWGYDKYGQPVWITDTIWNTAYSNTRKKAHYGYIKASCNTEIEQDIWDLRNDCGLGKIERRWKVHTKCGSTNWYSKPTVYKATIEIVPGCDVLDKHMIQIPSDTTVCGSITYAEDRTVDLGSDFPTPTIEAHEGCHPIGMSISDQLFRLVGKEDTYKIIRSHKFKSWCTGEELTFKQKIIIDETCAHEDDSSEGNSAIALDTASSLSRSRGDKITTFKTEYSQQRLEEFISEVTVSPNPSSHVLDIALSTNGKFSTPLTGRYTFTNAFGQTVLEVPANIYPGLNPKRISIRHLASGVYILQFQTDAYQILVDKITIQK